MWTGRSGALEFHCLFVADGWRDPSSTAQSYIALIRNSLRRCTAHKHYVLWSRAGQTHKLMLMVTAPLYWPPASNVGSLCISPVCPCRYHPPKSRGAVERSCYLWVRGAIFFHIQPSEPQIPACVSGPRCPPLAPFQPAQGPSIRKGTPPSKVRLPQKPWREGEVVEKTTVLLQHWS